MVQIIKKWIGVSPDDGSQVHHNLQSIAVDSSNHVYVFDDASKFTSRWFQLPQILIFDENGVFS